MFRALATAALLALLSGCALLPDVSSQPRVQNPFPQLAKVAVLEFFNQSSEPTVDGRRFAMAYFNELQLIPGFEVVPPGVTQQAVDAVKRSGFKLEGPEDIRRLAQLLEVDAVVVGTVTDYSPYYPPRCTLKVEWYAANPSFHPIPAGYGLPWGTVEESDIPDPLVYEAEMALAKAQLATQTPDYKPDRTWQNPPENPPAQEAQPDGPPPAQPQPQPQISDDRTVRQTSAVGEAATAATAPADQAPENQTPASETAAAVSVKDVAAATERPLPPDWPDPSGFIPPAPSAQRPPPHPNDKPVRPVMQHTRAYKGNDPEFTTALESYVYFRDDARFGGWQGYLQRSEDFVRFCCHKHIAEMLTARGGAGKTQVVWRWSADR